MRQTFIVLLTLTLVFAGCDDDAEREVASIEHFQVHLKADMKYDDMVRTFGEPDDEIGSGLHIYVYNLNDGSKVKIGYADKIFYATHVDVNDQLLDVLI